LKAVSDLSTIKCKNLKINIYIKLPWGNTTNIIGKTQAPNKKLSPNLSVECHVQTPWSF
jgi:hypothetical protein